MASFVLNCNDSLSVIRNITKNYFINSEDNIIIDCEGNFAKNNSDSVNGLILHPLEFALLLCRKGKCFKNKYVTLLSHQDHIDTVQVCIAQYNKCTIGEYSCTIEEQVEFEKYLHQKESVNVFKNDKMRTILTEYNKCVSDWNVVSETLLYDTLKDNLRNGNLTECLSKMFIIVQGIPAAALHKEILIELFGIANTTLCNTVILDESGITDHVKCSYVNIEINDIEDVWKESQVEYTPKAPSRTQHFLQHDFLSYLTILINNRSEIALTRCLSGFGCHLTHEAFTALKKESRASGIPMYQKALSFTMRISLGGKGYAPSLDSPLLPYVKEISEFMAVMEKLQSIVEDGVDTPHTITRVLNILKNIIVKRMDTALKGRLNIIIAKMEDLVSVLLKRCSHPDYTSPARTVSSGGSICGQKTIKVLRLLVERLSAELPAHAVFEMSSQGNCSPNTSPYVLPSLISRYKSPQELLQQLQESEALTQPTKVIPQEVKLQFHNSRSWVVAEPLNDDDLSQISTTTPVRGCESKFAQPRRVLADCNNKQTDKQPLVKAKPAKRNLMISGLQDKENPLGCGKRKATETDVEFSKLVKKPKCSAEKQSKPKKSIKLIAGQSKLTNFFRAVQ